MFAPEVITLWSCMLGVGYVCCYCSETIPIRTHIALMDEEIKQHKMDCTKYLMDMEKVFMRLLNSYSAW